MGDYVSRFPWRCAMGRSWRWSREACARVEDACSTISVVQHGTTYNKEGVYHWLRGRCANSLEGQRRYPACWLRSRPLPKMRRDRSSFGNCVASAFASRLQTGMEQTTSLKHVRNGLEEILSSRNGLEAGTICTPLLLLLIGQWQSLLLLNLKT